MAVPYGRIELYDGTITYSDYKYKYDKGPDGKYYPKGSLVDYTSNLTGTVYKPTVDDYAKYQKESYERYHKEDLPTRHNVFDYEKWFQDTVTNDRDAWNTQQQQALQAQRDAAQAEQDKQRQQFEQEQQQAAQAADAARKAHEAKLAEEKAAFEKQQKVKADALGKHHEINAKTLLGDYERMRDGESQLVAKEDKGLLSSDDKQQLFSSRDDEDTKKKGKQSLLERIKAD